MRRLAILLWFGLAPAALADDGITSPGQCLRAPYAQADTPHQARLAELVTHLRSHLAAFATLRDTLDAIGPTICLSDALMAEHGFMTVEDRQIVLNAALPDDKMLLTLVHELRHLEQLREGVCPSPGLSMRENARATFVIEADANVVTLLVGWQARADGQPALWQILKTWDSTADIAEEFERVMANTGDLSEAASAAFDQWYARPDRRENYYLQSCSDYLDRQDERHALPSYKRMDPGFLDALCHLPDGTSYDCTEPPGALAR
ncbi:DUF6782 family putative metallopeptidase [Marimonas lutisalis]|uniref:DUF6782 family putative metallopeptidase n=1 Tax=Marimonas lutisalis TaxID=2545756 RepID=UPI0010F62FFA|nr:DUF6782 family putative metallopeptidase [Marimonas lutisalis]